MPTETKPLPKMKSIKREFLLYEVVQDEIRSYIVQHSLGTGDRLPPETELAQQLCVSRNSVREAVKSLAALGILEARPGAGLFVREFSFDPLLKNLAYGLMVDLKQFVEMLEVRYYTDLGMSKKIVESVTGEQIEALRAVMRRIERSVEDGVYVPDDDQAFHRILYENLGNATLARVMDIFWLVCHQARKQSSLPQLPDPKEMYEQHYPMLAALEAADLDKFRQALAIHYSSISCLKQPNS